MSSFRWSLLIRTSLIVISFKQTVISSILPKFIYKERKQLNCMISLKKKKQNQKKEP